MYHGVVNARVAHKRNNARKVTEETHKARAFQNLLKEFQMLYGQECASGDDMNIIQIGRPAVSRYHQIRRLFGTGAGPDYEIHDFPMPELGIKLGGFMIISPPTTNHPRERRNSCEF